MNAHHETSPVTSAADIDWGDWLQRWDEQQTGYLPHRDARFTAMLDVLEALLPPDFTALDLCCGPGSISQRLLARFPKAHCIAADLDPVLLAMGQAVLGDGGGRLRWVEIDLMQTDDLPAALGIEQVDAVLSTTALHWLPAANLVQVYHQLGQLVRPGGLFLNGDNINFRSSLKSHQFVADNLKQKQQQAAFEQNGVENWEQWWTALADEPTAVALLAERERRFTWEPKDVEAPIIDLHEAALYDAGFGQVGTIWQYFDDRVLMAVK